MITGQKIISLNSIHLVGSRARFKNEGFIGQCYLLIDPCVVDILNVVDRELVLIKAGSKIKEVEVIIDSS